MEGWRFRKADSTCINQSSGLVIQKVGSLRVDGYPWGWEPSDPGVDPAADPLLLEPEAIPEVEPDRALAFVSGLDMMFVTGSPV